MGESFRIDYLKLHMIVAFKYGEMPLGIGFHYCIAIFEMILGAAELPERAPLQVGWYGGEGLVFKAVGELTTQVSVGEKTTRLHKVWLYGIFIGPKDVLERASARPPEAFDCQVQEGRHDATRAERDLRELPAIEKGVGHRQLCS